MHPDSATAESLRTSPFPLPLQVQVDAEQVTSDGGLPWLAEAEAAVGICAALAARLPDWRRRASRHSLEAPVRQRVFQIACGYQDQNDATSLRTDPLLEPVCGRRPLDEAALASQPTFSRLENAVDRRSCYWLAYALAGVYLRQRAPGGRPRRLLLDLDSTDDPTHGDQEGAAYHGYYQQHMYHPLLTFDGDTHQLITAVLRAGNAHASRGIVSILRRLVRLLRAWWPGVRIEVRADSGFAVPALYTFCEQGGIGYTIGLAPNARLAQLAAPLLARARRLREERQGAKVRLTSEAARAETGLLGISPWNLRVLPTLLGAGMVALSGAYVRRLGGSLRLQALALLIAITAPYFLGANWVFQTVTFDEATWMVALYWFLSLLLNARPRYWIYLGITLGIGLEVKFTILGLIAGIILAVLVTPQLRAQLRSPYPWIGGAIALLIWLPNVVWQVAEGFPTLVYIANHRDSAGGPVANVLTIVVYLFFLLPLWVAGMVSLFRSTLLRPLGIACMLPLVLFLFVGKSYYAVGTVPVVLAQGLMALARVKRPRLGSILQIGVVIAAALQFLVFLQLILPVTPPDRMHAAGLDTKNELFADSVGWDDIARQVQTIYGHVVGGDRGSTIIISAYYGVPGALRIYGYPARLSAVVSPQLSDYYWLPKHLTATYALLIDYQPAAVRWLCTAPQIMTHLTVPYGVTGLEQGAPVTFCRLKLPVSRAWGRLRNFS